MIAIVDKDRVHIAVPIVKMGGLESVNLQAEDLIKRENLPIWKIKGKKNAVMGGYYNYRQNDVVRYDRELFGKNINLETLSNKTIKRIEEIVENDPLIDGETRLNTYYVAIKNKAYLVERDFVMAIENYNAEGIYNDMVASVLKNCGEMNCDDKLRLIGEAASAYYGLPFLPMVVIDTRTEKLRIVK